jgi:hypothetical protein
VEADCLWLRARLNDWLMFFPGDETQLGSEPHGLDTCLGSGYEFNILDILTTLACNCGSVKWWLTGTTLGSTEALLMNSKTYKMCTSADEQV